MTSGVIDTCVAVVANGRDTRASDECQLKCIEVLEALVASGPVVIDQQGQILQEYDRHLHAQGQPGVGDRFYRYLLDNQGAPRRVNKVDTNAARGAALRDAFDAGQLSAFDPADRVFALCSAIARVPVYTAVDPDWTEHDPGLRACGVRIEYACGRATAAAGGANIDLGEG